MVDEFEQWCFEPHNAGDTAIVKSDYGYHIIYYVGLGENYRLYTAETNKRAEDYNTWRDSKLETGYDVSQTFMFVFAD